MCQAVLGTPSETGASLLRAAWSLLLACSIVTASAQPATTQSVDFTGYALALGTYVGDTDLADGGLSDFQRLRGMAAFGGDGWRFDGAYEHTLTLREAGASGAQLFTSGGASSNGDWLDLGGTIEDGESVTWGHRVDRVTVSVDVTDRAEVIVGRQPVSWATTLVFTPADPFSPFDPADPFREYRQGVDAARVRIYPNAVSEIDVVVRRSDFGFQETTTAAVRGSTSVRGWDVSAWAGLVHDKGGGAIAISGSVGTWAIRAEGSLRNVDGTTLRTAVGVDRFSQLAGKDLYVIAEYLHDGFGVSDVADAAMVATSEAARRGELQSLGSDEGAIQASYQVHPLVGLSGLVLVNLHDGSTLFAPGVSVSATSGTSVRAGTYLSTGDGSRDESLAPRSEYGGVPGVFYLALSWFF